MSRRIEKFFCAKGAAAIRKSPRPKTSRGVRRRSPGVNRFIMLFFAVRDPHKSTAGRLRARYFYCSGIPWQIGVILNCLEPQSQRSSRRGINVRPERLSE